MCCSASLNNTSYSAILFLYTDLVQSFDLVSINYHALQANRLVGLECLAQCTRSFAQNRSTSPDVEQHLSRLLEPAIVSIRKGNIASQPKQLAVLHQLCLDCMSYAPQYVTDLLVMLMKHDAWECMLEGVRAAFAIMTRSAARLSQISVFDEVSIPNSVCCLRLQVMPPGLPYFQGLLHILCHLPACA